VPPSPNLGWAEHMTSAAHVTVGSLSATVGTATRNTRNTRHGTTGSPRSSSSLHTSVLGHGVSLSGVLSDVRVHSAHDIRSQRSFRENERKGHLVLAVPVHILNTY
jgi:hypothetical protein